MPGWGSVRLRARTPLALLVSAAALIGAGAAPARADFGGGRAYFTTPIPANAAVDLNSSYWLGQIGAQFPQPYLNGPGNRFSPPVYEASGAPARVVRCAYCGPYTGAGRTGYADALTMPIPDGAQPDPSPDGHMAVIDRARGVEWDLIGALRDPVTGVWTARGAGQFDLAGDGHQNTAAGGGSATASRLPLSPAVSVAEVRRAISNGSYLIPHALQFTAPNVDGRCWVYPALGSDGPARDGMPEGARVRLDPGYDVRSLSPAARVLARTLQVYGAFNRDVGNAFAFYLREPRGSDEQWSSVGIDGDSLASIPVSRFAILRTDYSTDGTTQPLRTRPDQGCALKNFSGADASRATRTDRVRPGPPGRPRVRKRLQGRRVTATLCWRAARDDRGVVRYHVLIDGRLRATPSARCSGPLRLRRGRVNVVRVGAVDAAGNEGPLSVAVRVRA
jgi:hypothetical protein